MKLLQVSLASSAELKPDREQFEIFINRKNKQWIKQGFFIELVIWEDFLDAFSINGLQNEYNKAIRECDVFVMLYHTKVGKFTQQEFETALASFQQRGRPIIYTFCKKPPLIPSESPLQEPSLQEFRAQLDALGHFATIYRNTEDLLLRFGTQMDRLRATGLLHSGTSPSSPPSHPSPTLPKPRYLLGAMIELLDHTFTAEELETFVLTHFEDLRRQFTPGMQQSTRIQLLVTHARNHGRIPELLRTVESLYPHPYAQWGPYEVA